jgi:hypothetical protein
VDEMTDQEYVRANWIRAELCPCPYNNRFNTSLGGRGFTLSNPSEEDTPEEAWSAAAEFTRERLEQIRQLEAEIDAADVMRKSSTAAVKGAVLRGEHDLPFLLEDVRSTCAWQRILARLEAALDDLNRGMKKAGIGDE